MSCLKVGVSPIISMLRADSAHLSEGLFAPEVGSSSHLSVMLQAANARTPMKRPFCQPGSNQDLSFFSYVSCCNFFFVMYGGGCSVSAVIFPIISRLAFSVCPFFRWVIRGPPFSWWSWKPVCSWWPLVAPWGTPQGKGSCLYIISQEVTRLVRCPQQRLCQALSYS